MCCAMQVSADGRTVQGNHCTNGSEQMKQIGWSCPSAGWAMLVGVQWCPSGGLVHPVIAPGLYIYILPLATPFVFKQQLSLPLSL